MRCETCHGLGTVSAKKRELLNGVPLVVTTASPKINHLIDVTCPDAMVLVSRIAVKDSVPRPKECRDPRAGLTSGLLGRVVAEWGLARPQYRVGLGVAWLRVCPRA
jgi:hypothetical protein